MNWLDAGLVDEHDRCASLGAQQPSRNLRHATIRRVPRSAETAMLEYRIRMLGQTREDGFTVTRRDGDAWVWLPVRFPTYSAADQWITQQQENEFARVTRGVSERTD